MRILPTAVLAITLSSLLGCAAQPISHAELNSTNDRLHRRTNDLNDEAEYWMKESDPEMTESQVFREEGERFLAGFTEVNREVKAIITRYVAENPEVKTGRPPLLVKELVYIRELSALWIKELSERLKEVSQ